MLNNKAQRKLVRKLGFKVYRSKQIAKLMAWIYSRANMCVYWVLKQTEGYLVINCDDQERLNKLAKMQNKKKLRVRDLEKGCVYRTPKTAQWDKLLIIQS